MYTLEREAQLYRQTASHYDMIAEHGYGLFFRPEDLAQLVEHERWKLEQNLADQGYVRERIETHEENIIFTRSSIEAWNATYACLRAVIENE